MPEDETTQQGSAFGEMPPDAMFADPAPESGGEPAADTPTTPAAPAETVPPAEPAPEPIEPALDEAPAPAEEAEVAAETETPAPLLAGAFTDAEQLEQGYNHLRNLQRTTAEQNNALRAQLEQIVANQQAMQEAQQRAAQTPTPIPPEFAQFFEERGVDPDLLPAIQGLIGVEADQRVQAVRDEMAQQVAQQQLANQNAERYREAHGVISAFRADHPDVPPGSAQDLAVGATVEEFNLNLGDRDALEIAYEAVKRPMLAEALRANPNRIDTDAGMREARELAGRWEAQAAQNAQQQQQDPARAQAVKNARVETGGAAPATSSGTNGDEFDEAIAAHATNRKSAFVTGA